MAYILFCRHKKIYVYKNTKKNFIKIFKMNETAKDIHPSAKTTEPRRYLVKICSLIHHNLPPVSHSSYLKVKHTV